MQTNPPDKENTLPPAKMLNGPRGLKLAYDYRKGRSDLPAVVYLHGYASDMQATKAEYLAKACAVRNQSYLRFDYAGNGRSEGNFADGILGDWIDDALAIIDGVTQEDLLLVGSSMGGWIGLQCALRRPHRVKAFIGIAAAPDFTEEIPLAESAGYYESSEGLRFYNGFIADGKNHLLLAASISLDIPVVLLQGRQDTSVPWETAYKLQEKIAPSRAEIILVEDGDHRLARPQDLELLDRVVQRISAGL